MTNSVVPFSDLESYFNNYTGYVKLARLMFIAQKCKQHRLEALILALQFVKTETLCYIDYQRIFNYLQRHVILLKQQQEEGLLGDSAGSNSNSSAAVTAEEINEAAFEKDLNAWRPGSLTEKDRQSAHNLSPRTFNEQRIVLPSSYLNGASPSSPSSSTSHNNTNNTQHEEEGVGTAGSSSSAATQSGGRLIEYDAESRTYFIQFDNKWVEIAQRTATNTLDQLNVDLRTYRTNNILDSVRRSGEDLANFYVRLGELGSAAKHFHRARDSCKTETQEVEVCLSLARICAIIHNWSHVFSYSARAASLWQKMVERHPWLASSASESAGGGGAERKSARRQQQHQMDTSEQSSASSISSSTAGGEQDRLASSLKSSSTTRKNSAEIQYRAPNQISLYSGLTNLANGFFRQTVTDFLKITYDESEGNLELMQELVSMNDVAIITSLCALATLERREVIGGLIECSNFKLFLENEPNIRKLLHHFTQFQFSEAFQLLDTMKPQLALDIFMTDQVDKLYVEIRNRAMLQYLAPFLTADLAIMAREFGRDADELEMELVRLIMEERLHAKIQSEPPLPTRIQLRLHTLQDERRRVFSSAMRMVDAHTDNMRLNHLRLASARAGFIVRNA